MWLSFPAALASPAETLLGIHDWYATFGEANYLQLAILCTAATFHFPIMDFPDDVCCIGCLFF